MIKHNARKNDMTYNQLDKYVDNIKEFMYTCKCGHKVMIDNHRIKTLCNWCGNYVFKSKKDEFMYRMGIKLNGRKNI